jgi:hypothetical protein
MILKMDLIYKNTKDSGYKLQISVGENGYVGLLFEYVSIESNTNEILDIRSYKIKDLLYILQNNNQELNLTK